MDERPLPDRPVGGILTLAQLSGVVHGTKQQKFTGLPPCLIVPPPPGTSGTARLGAAAEHYIAALKAIGITQKEEADSLAEEELKENKELEPQEEKWIMEQIERNADK